MRTFVAVTPPEYVLDRMADYVGRLRPLAPYKWVSRAQLHLTLRFLGEAPRSQVDAVAEALHRAEGAAFEVDLGRVGGFPHIERPRVLWIGGIAGMENLAALAEKVEKAAVDSGFPPETKKFNPHLTLARARDVSALPPELAKALKPVPSLVWRVSRFSLIQSELTPKGPIYTSLKEYLLR
jgi:2'-5' RNA ligase